MLAKIVADDYRAGVEHEAEAARKRCCRKAGLRDDADCVMPRWDREGPLAVRTDKARRAANRYFAWFELSMAIGIFEARSADAGGRGSRQFAKVSAGGGLARRQREDARAVGRRRRLRKSYRRDNADGIGARRQA